MYLCATFILFIFADLLYSYFFICILNFLQDEIEQLRSKYTLLDNESLTTINNLQCQITKLNLQLKQQSTFNSIIGSTFGYYLWKATKIPSVIDIVLQKVKNYNNVTNINKQLFKMYI